KVPGIAEAPIRLECKLFELRQITARRHLCIAEVLALSARDGILDPETYHVDIEAYRPIGRLYGDSYAELASPFEIPVPKVPT
ncbi:MAG: flavin reductase family protein, partial [Pseudomonadota bacterium]